MKRGISPVLATVLIVLVVITLAGAFYTFTGETASQTTEAAEESQQEFAEETVNTFRIESVADNKAFLRNTGDDPIEQGDLTVFLSDVLINYTITSPIQPGDTGTVHLNKTWKAGYGEHQLRIEGSPGDSVLVNVEKPESGGNVLDMRFEDPTTGPRDSSGENNHGKLFGQTVMLQHLDEAGDTAVIDEDFSGSSLDTDTWNTFGGSHGSISVSGGELVITQTAGGSTNENIIGVSSDLFFPPGSVMKAKVKNTEGRHAAVAATGKSPFCPYAGDSSCSAGATLYSRADASPPSATTSLQREDGSTTTGTPSVQDYTQYQTVELRRVSRDVVEFYVDGEKVDEFTSTGLSDMYRFYFSTDGATAPSTIVVDEVKVIAPYTMDETGYGNHGVITNDPNWVDGASGTALDFDGTDDIVNVSSDPTLEMEEELTLSAWVNPDSIGGKQVVVANDHGNEADYSLRLDDSDISGRFWECTGRPEPKDGSGKVEAGKWQHIVLSMNETGGTNEISFYYNGEHTATVTQDISFCNNGEDVQIGSDSYGDDSPREPFDGKIDEVALYNRTLSEEEVSKIYEEGKGSFVEYTEGQHEEAVGFDGVDDRVNVPNDPSIHLDGEDFTISTWMRPEPQGKNRFVYHKWRPNAYLLKDDETINFEVDDGSNQFVSISLDEKIDGSTWYFLVQKVEQGKQHCGYVFRTDGLVGKDCVSIGTTSGSDGDPLLISRQGWHASDNSWYGGRVDELMIHTEAYNPDELYVVNSA